MEEEVSPTQDLASAVGPRRTQSLESGDPGQLGPYRLLCRLPRGGQGADVFVGRAPATGGLVVLKRLPSGAGELTRRRFAHEVANAARIRGPRVARLVDQDLGAESPYYVQEFIAGTPLDEFLEQREQAGLNAEELRRVALGLLRALRDAHAAGVVHRDVKPGNIIVSDKGVYLVDLGISSVIGADRPAGTVTTGLNGLGSKLFASPEQLQGMALTEASDVYSWGMVIAYAAGGRHPVDPDDELSPSDYWLELRAGRVDLSAVPHNLHDSVSHALRFAPEKRPSLAGLARQVEQNTRWLTQTSQIPAPRAAIGDFRSLAAGREVLRYHLSRLERAVADTTTGFAVALVAVVLLGMLAGLILAVVYHLIV